jgi:hypothetical protein
MKMAQIVGYYENDVKYKEGPFVICNPLGNGWRIEVELKGHYCPVLPDLSIYPIIRALGLNGKTHDKNLITRICDALNRMVADGEVVLVRKMWCANEKE